MKVDTNPAGPKLPTKNLMNSLIPSKIKHKQKTMGHKIMKGKLMSYEEVE